MTRLDFICRVLVIVPLGMGAAWISASEPMIWAMPQAARAFAVPVEPVPVSPPDGASISIARGETR